MSDQIRTTYHETKRFPEGRITARFISGPHKGERLTVAYDHWTKDPYLEAANALLRKTNDREWTYSDTAGYVGTGVAGGNFCNTYRTFAPLMPAWVGEVVR